MAGKCGNCSDGHGKPKLLGKCADCDGRGYVNLRPESSLVYVAPVLGTCPACRGLGVKMTHPRDCDHEVYC